MLVPFFSNSCSINWQILFAVEHNNCFSIQSTGIGMSLVNVWSVMLMARNELLASTPSVCGMLEYREFTSIIANIQVSLSG